MKYIRFKDIPPNEISNIFDGDLGIVGHELGVSCYNFKEYDDCVRIILPSICVGVIYDLLNFIEDVASGTIPVYIIEAEQVGLGTYGEPVVKNVKMVNELKMVQLQNPPPKFKQDRTNPQFVIKT